MDSHDDLARRLYAAWYSHHLGHAGVDRTLKLYVRPGRLGEYWRSLARQVEKDASGASSDALVQVRQQTKKELT